MTTWTLMLMICNLLSRYLFCPFICKAIFHKFSNQMLYFIEMESFIEYQAEAQTRTRVGKHAENSCNTHISSPLNYRM